MAIISFNYNRKTDNLTIRDSRTNGGEKYVRKPNETRDKWGQPYYQIDDHPAHWLQVRWHQKHEEVRFFYKRTLTPRDEEDHSTYYMKNMPRNSIEEYPWTVTEEDEAIQHRGERWSQNKWTLKKNK